MNVDYHGADIQKILKNIPEEDEEKTLEKLNRELRKHPELDENYSSWILRLVNARKNETYRNLCNQTK